MTNKSVSPDNPLPTGSLTVTVDQFRSLGALTPLQATISGWTGFQLPEGQPLPTPEPTLKLTDNNIVISSQYPVSLIFNLPDSRYILLGVAWEADLRPKAVGEKAFPEVIARRDVTFPQPFQPVISGSSLQITDEAQTPGRYEYVLLIQEVETGEIGMFDPGMDNDPEI